MKIIISIFKIKDINKKIILSKFTAEQLPPHTQPVVYMNSS